MRKGTGIFKNVEETKLVCDRCGADINILEWIRYSNKWTDGYDNYGDSFDYCSLDCLLGDINTDRSCMLPPESEDVMLNIPTKGFIILLNKLGD